MKRRRRERSRPVDAGHYRESVLTAWHAVAPREFLASNDLAQSFALPAAIAAHLVHPDRYVVCFTGANEVGAVATELETVARLAARIVIVVHETDGTGAAAMRLADEVGLCNVVATEAAFQAFGRALNGAGGSLIVVRP